MQVFASKGRKCSINFLLLNATGVFFYLFMIRRSMTIKTDSTSSFALKMAF